MVALDIFLAIVVLALPGLFCWLVEWLIHRKDTGHHYTAGCFPYLFVIICCISFFAGRGILHRLNKIDTLGSVREVPLVQEPWKMRLMNWDMHHAVLNFDGSCYVDNVTHIEDINDSILLFRCTEEVWEETEPAAEEDSTESEAVTETNTRIGGIIAGRGQIIYDDSITALSSGKMTDVEHYYDERYHMLTSDWLGLILIIGMVMGIMSCILLYWLANGKKKSVE